MLTDSNAPRRSKLLERMAILVSVLILTSAGWFWIRQIQAAKELLEMAGG